MERGKGIWSGGRGYGAGGGGYGAGELELVRGGGVATSGVTPAARTEGPAEARPAHARDGTATRRSARTPTPVQYLRLPAGVD